MNRHLIRTRSEKGPETEPETRVPVSKHEQKECPRCSAGFECKVNNAAHCQCAGIELSERLVDRLSADWRDCLCADCLRELADIDKEIP